MSEHEKDLYEMVSNLDARLKGIEEKIPTEEKIKKLVRSEFEEIRAEAQKAKEEKAKEWKELLEKEGPFIDLETGEQYPPAYGPPPYYPPRYPPGLYPVPKLIDLLKKLSKGKLDMTLADFITKVLGGTIEEAKEKEKPKPTETLPEGTTIEGIFAGGEITPKSLDQMTPEQVSDLVDQMFPGRFPKRSK